MSTTHPMRLLSEWGGGIARSTHIITYIITITTNLDNGDIAPTNEKLSYNQSNFIVVRKIEQINKDVIHPARTDGKPRLSPIPPKADTSSNRTRKRLNHFMDSSKRFFRSMMAMMNTAHTSHQISAHSDNKINK